MLVVFDKENIDPNIPAVVIMSHGGISAGATQTIEMLTGDKTNVIALGIEPGEGLDDYLAKLEEVYEVVPESSIYLVDIFGGTPFNTILTFCRKHGVLLNCLAGFNVPMLLEACIMRNSMSGPDLIKQLMEQEEHGVSNVSERIGALLNK